MSFRSISKLLFKSGLSSLNNFLHPQKINIISTIYIQNKYYNISVICLQKEKKKDDLNQLAHQSYFRNEDKSKETFIEAINMYKTKERQLKGHVEFIHAALKQLENYGVERELEVYKALLDLFPKGTMVPRNIWQQEFLYYPKHQFCAMAVLEKLTDNGVMPDTELCMIVKNTFGEWNGPTKKLKRILYWLPKFKFASPWPTPHILTRDPLKVTKMAISQITSMDQATEISFMETSSVKDSIDDTWIVSATSPSQRELIKRHCPSEPIKLEGPFGTYVQDQQINYFVLRADSKSLPTEPTMEDFDDVTDIYSWVTEKRNIKEQKALLKPRTVHEQDDGIILSICATGTSSRDSVLSWIRLLEQRIPELENIVVLFKQSSPIGDVIVVDEKKEQQLS